MRKSITILSLLMLLGINNLTNAQEPLMGEIKMFAGNFAPRGWALCDGQLLAISQHQALFSILGTVYGGDGRTTFALPDLRSRVPMHPGSGPGLTPRTLGEKGGEETNTLSVSQIPSHTHNVNVVEEDGNESIPTGNVPAGTKVLDKEYSSNSPNATMNSETISNTGGGQPVNNVQPYTTVNFIIALQGVFPSSN